MLSLTQLSEEYLNCIHFQNRLSPLTIAVYEYDMKTFLSFINYNYKDSFSLLNVNKLLLQRYLGSLNDQFKVKTVKRKMACLRGFFKYLEDMSYISSNPFNSFKFYLKEPYMLPNVMTSNEVEKIIQAAYAANSVIADWSRLK